MSNTVASVVRYARAGVRVLGANLRQPSTPWKLSLCLTYWCQYRCKTCNIWKRKPEHELTTDEWLQLIERNPDAVWVDLIGGEIFLRPDVETILEAIVTGWKHLAILHFPTNGFLTDKIVRITSRLAAGATADIVVTVSLDGDEELNDEIRGIKGGFRRQMATFTSLRRIPGVRVVLGMTVSGFNAGQVEHTFEACRKECPDLRPDELHLNVAQVSEHYYGNEGTPGLLTSAVDSLAEIKRHRLRRSGRPTPAAWLEDAYLGQLERYLQTGVTPTRCHALRSTCFVDPWGVVYPCISYSRPLGSLRETAMDLRTIWQSQAVDTVRREIWNGVCPQCWTACEAYPSILGNVLVPGRRRTPAP